MIKVKVEEDLVYDTDKMIKLDNSDGIRDQYVSLLEDLSCTVPKHEDYPNEVVSDKDGYLKEVKVCCPEFENQIRETITGE